MDVDDLDVFGVFGGLFLGFGITQVSAALYSSVHTRRGLQPDPTHLDRLLCGANMRARIAIVHEIFVGATPGNRRSIITAQISWIQRWLMRKEGIQSPSPELGGLRASECLCCGTRLGGFLRLLRDRRAPPQLSFHGL